MAIGHDQGTVGGSSSLYDIGLSKGYAIVHSSGTRTSTHYNLVLGAETAIMTKERFIEGYGVRSTRSASAARAARSSSTSTRSVIPA